jgi:formylglycine-generating enzyme required for sulfatase activity
MRGKSAGWSGLGVVLALLVGAPALSKEPGEKYALLVGVRSYDPNELRSLPYSEADVTELAEVLRASGYKPGNVVLMTQTVGAGQPRLLPLAGQVRKELRLLLQDLAENDGVLVALAGHGVQFVGDPESYFCPADAKLADKSTLIPLGEVYKELEACGAGMKVLLVDACRNDPQSDNSRARAVVSLESVTRPRRVKPPGGVVAFFSCSEGEKAFEHAELKHGVFFHFVIEALRGASVAAEEREVLMPDLEKFVKRRMRDFVREKYGVRQIPELKGTTRDLVPLVSLDRARIKIPDRPVPPSTSSPGESKLKTIPNSIGMKLTLISAGTFQMGSPERDTEAETVEKPQHRVRITQPFYLGVHEVTRGQFRRFVDEAGYQTEAEKDGKGGFGWNEETKKFEQNTRYTWQNPGFEQTDDHPVVNVSWNDAVAFAAWLSRKEGNTYRLPTEAEWEYACRAGTTTRYFVGDDPEGLAAVGNVVDGTGKAKYPDWTGALAARDGYIYTAPVGQFQPNRFGLYDMHGNVYEWCSDGYAADYYKQSPVDDPPGAAGAALRVVRGGCWGFYPRYCRSASRGRSAPVLRNFNVGFRLARVQSSR